MHCIMMCRFYRRQRCRIYIYIYAFPLWRFVNTQTDLNLAYTVMTKSEEPDLVIHFTNPYTRTHTIMYTYLRAYTVRRTVYARM